MDAVNNIYQNISETIRKLTDNPLVHFLLFWLANSLAYVMAFGALSEILPSRLEWVSNAIFPICVFGGFVTSAAATWKDKSAIPSGKALANSTVVGLIGLFMLISLYTISFAFSPPKYITYQDFEVAKLNNVQVQEIQQLLDARGYITLNDLDTIGLTYSQKQTVKNLLDELGYVTKDDVEIIAQNIYLTQVALGATQTAIEKATSCYVTPEETYSTVYVRESDSESSAPLGAISGEQKLFVTAHNGGRINQDMWWLVEFGDDENGQVYGWIASSAVKEINEDECYKVEKSQGSN